MVSTSSEAGDGRPCSFTPPKEEETLQITCQEAGIYSSVVPKDTSTSTAPLCCHSSLSVKYMAREPKEFSRRICCRAELCRYFTQEWKLTSHLMLSAPSSPMWDSYSEFPASPEAESSTSSEAEGVFFMPILCQSICFQFRLGNRRFSPMVPSSAAPRTGQGVSFSIPRSRSLTMQRKAMENRIMPQLRLMMPRISTAASTRENRMDQKPIPSRKPSCPAMTAQAPSRNRIPQNTFFRSLIIFSFFLPVFRSAPYNSCGTHRPSLASHRTPRRWMRPDFL